MKGISEHQDFDEILNTSRPDVTTFDNSTKHAGSELTYVAAAVDDEDEELEEEDDDAAAMEEDDEEDEEEDVEDEAGV
jgi:hypothetical protein